MSDQKDFLEFLGQTGMVITCPNCGGENWSVVRGDLVIHDPEGNLKPAYLIRCDGCGHERLFSPEDPNGEPGG
jgi:DNA-directed RNA polymerase subunit RPC12/RpoP